MGLKPREGRRDGLRQRRRHLQPALKAFGHGRQVGGWLAEKHPLFLADVTGDVTPDIVGVGGTGVYVARPPPTAHRPPPTARRAPCGEALDLL
ncbi:hypothetical protein [Streptomyces sp. NPDC050546]|uniref:hypothetical protein n=1 Tax=Streptomyces sp. NPDC050546 TaxID=3365628 RepID=UPI0037AFE515